MTTVDPAPEPVRPERRGLAIIALAIATTLMLASGTAMAGYRIGHADIAGLPEDFTNIGRVFDLVDADAVESPEGEQLVEGAINGLLGTLEDPYAVYYDPERYAALGADLDGEFVGIGVTIEERTDGIYIAGVLPDSPAERAGVQAGERITAVDGVSALDSVTTGDVIELIAGEEGTPVTVSFDMGADGPRDLTMVRETLQLPEVESRVLDSGYGYAAIAEFSRRVDGDLTERIATMRQDNDIPGLILDLRGNPGGLLNEAVEVVSLFVDEGVVVRVDSRAGSRENSVLGEARFADLPLVVLVDANSASASEIVAGALQDLDRAQVVGTVTYGKGTVQTIQDLDLGAGVKFTTARYFTPSGDSIEGRGVQPDVVTGEDPDEQLAAAEAALAEAVAASGAGD